MSTYFDSPVEEIKDGHDILKYFCWPEENQDPPENCPYVPHSSPFVINNYIGETFVTRETNSTQTDPIQSGSTDPVDENA
jgi:hypothetical protein